MKGEGEGVDEFVAVVVAGFEANGEGEQSQRRRAGG